MNKTSRGLGARTATHTHTKSKTTNSPNVCLWMSPNALAIIKRNKKVVFTIRRQELFQFTFRLSPLEGWGLLSIRKYLIKYFVIEKPHRQTPLPPHNLIV